MMNLGGKCISIFFIGASGFMAAACGAGSGTVRLNMVSAPTALLSLSDSENVENWMEPFAANDSGQNSTAAQITALKYYITDIQICSSLTASGSAFSGATGCASLYSNSALQALTDPTLAQVEATGDPIDLMSSTSRALLAASTASVAAGTYNYATITWAPYLKVNANGTTLGGTTYKTLSTTGATFNSTTKTTTVAGALTGTQAEATVYTPNGGTYFRFTSPFVVAAGDSVTMDLAFNPVGIIKVGPCSNCSLLGSGGIGLNVPMLQLSPVPRKSSETTKRRVCTVTNATDKLSLRIELYYNSTDATKFYGVNGVTTMTTGRDGIMISEMMGKVTRIETAANGTLTFYSPNETSDYAVITGLSTTSGASGNITFSNGGYSGTGTNGTYPYTCTTTATDEAVGSG